jgi:hypothetical protein
MAGANAFRARAVKMVLGHVRSSQKSLLNYDCSVVRRGFQRYTDISTRQLGAVITQGRLLAFFSQKLNSAQQKYSVTKLELLSIVECLKESKIMPWGKKLKVYTDHKKLV